MNIKIEFKNIHSAKDYFDKVYNKMYNEICINFTKATILNERYNTVKDYLLRCVYKSFYDKDVTVYYDISINNDESYIAWYNEKGIFCSAKINDITPKIIGFGEVAMEKLKAPKGGNTIYHIK